MGNTNPRRSLEDGLEIPHALVGPIHAECAFYFGRYAAAGHTRGVREPPADPKRNASTHHSPLKTSHYMSHGQTWPLYMSTSFFFSERKCKKESR